MNFTPLEQALLSAILDERPDLRPGLEEQLSKASVTSRENTGGGFLTWMTVSDGVRKLSHNPPDLGLRTSAKIAGLRGELGVALWLKLGFVDCLDGHAWEDETGAVDFETAAFEVRRR